MSDQAVPGSSGGSLISVESTNEWQISEIHFDGQEKYFRPLTFSDYVAKFSNKVDWKALIGDDYSSVSAAPEDEGVEASKANENQTEEQSSRSTAAGPPSLCWEPVARKLNTALTELTVLLDVLQVASQPQRSYLSLQRVQNQEASDQHKLSGGPTPEVSKQTILATKKRIFAAANTILQEALAKLSLKGPLSDAFAQGGGDQSAAFQAELLQLRQQFRLKKIGNTIFGELAHKYPAPKFRPEATFEIQWGNNGHHLNVKVSKELEKPLDLIMSLSISEGSTWKHFTMPPSHRQNVSEQMSTAIGAKAAFAILRNAQKTLFNKDLFSQMYRESVLLSKKYASIKATRNEIVVPIPNRNAYLTISLRGASEVGAESSVGSHRYAFGLMDAINRLCNYEAFIKRHADLLRPVTCPLSLQSKRIRLAGPNAVRADDLREEKVATTNIVLLERAIELVENFAAMIRYRNAIEDFASNCRAPRVNVQDLTQFSPECFSVVITFVSPGYEQWNRSTICIEIRGSEIQLLTREGSILTGISTPAGLFHALKLLAVQHELFTLLQWLNRSTQWQEKFCDINHVAEDGTDEPMAIFCDSRSENCIEIHYNVQKGPKVFVKLAKFNAKSEFESGNRNKLLDEKIFGISSRENRPLNYEALPGENLMEKMEIFIVTLS